MEVILLERVAKLGQMGEVVRVKDGFARNYLLPQGKALRATEANKAKFEGMKVDLQAKNLATKAEAEKTSRRPDARAYRSSGRRRRPASFTARCRRAISPRCSRKTGSRSSAIRSRSTRRSRPSVSTR